MTLSQNTDPLEKKAISLLMSKVDMWAGVNPADSGGSG
jgi:hypothetical protein